MDLALQRAHLFSFALFRASVRGSDVVLLLLSRPVLRASLRSIVLRKPHWDVVALAHPNYSTLSRRRLRAGMHSESHTR